MNYSVPVPRITEGFMDKVLENMGGRRPDPKERAFEAEKNADYIIPGGIAELKILEEEGLDKKERQDKIALELRDHFHLPPEVDINIKHLHPTAKALYKELISPPLRKAVRKAAAQIKATKAHLGRPLDFGILIAVNNGFNSLPHDEFDNLMLTQCKTETSQIDFLLTTTVEYHQGDFDSYVFCHSGGYAKLDGVFHPYKERYVKAVHDEFGVRMTEMMRNMTPPPFDSEIVLQPVHDIRFERDGITFVRSAPAVPNSMFPETK